MVRLPRIQRRISSLRSRLGLYCLENRVVPASYTVSTAADSGPGSLRDIVAQANSSVGVVDDIFFNGSLTAATPILLTSGELTITDSVNPPGPTAANIVIDGNSLSRVFKVDNNSASHITVNFKNL